MDDKQLELPLVEDAPKTRMSPEEKRARVFAYIDAWKERRSAARLLEALKKASEQGGS